MYLQLARFLLKVYNWSAKNPSRVPSHFAYIKDLNGIIANAVKATSDEQISSVENLGRLLT